MRDNPPTPECLTLTSTRLRLFDDFCREGDEGDDDDKNMLMNDIKWIIGISWLIGWFVCFLLCIRFEKHLHILHQSYLRLLYRYCFEFTVIVTFLHIFFFACSVRSLISMSRSNINIRIIHKVSCFFHFVFIFCSSMLNTA